MKEYRFEIDADKPFVLESRSFLSAKHLVDKYGKVTITTFDTPPEPCEGGGLHEDYEVHPSMGDPLYPSGVRCRKCQRQIWY